MEKDPQAEEGACLSLIPGAFFITRFSEAIFNAFYSKEAEAATAFFVWCVSLHIHWRSKMLNKLTHPAVTKQPWKNFNTYS